MKKQIQLIITCSLFLIGIQQVKAIDWTIDVTVDQDGGGDYTTINDALAANPNDGSNYVIYIKKGVYNEKLFITQNNITLIGESRDSTIITQAILRRIFRDEVEDTDWGVATINIADDVTDLTLANLTVQNNFADLNPDVENNTDHTMAIRGGGDRIIIVNCNIIATGGDTLSLWNTNGGRYYHSGCYFEGYVDYVCPRGYCYISNSDFYGYNNNASIWHDGSGGKDHKLVVKNSYFNGEEFGLGRFHRMAAFYLLDCDFSAEMVNNGGINYVGDSAAQDRDKLIYGKRVYFDRCIRKTGNYEWHQDNLQTAEGSPDRNMITDSWTFLNTWNPEDSIAELLECAFLPQPGYCAKEVDPLPVLSWLPGKSAVSHLLYFGEDSVPNFVAEVSDTSHTITTPLKSATYYFWRLDEITEQGDTIPGNLWSFSTRVSELAAPAYNPYPENDADFQIRTVHLQWEANMLEVDSFHLYFGSEDKLDLITVQQNADYYLYNLENDSVYYWRIDVENGYGITEGPLWHFNYRMSTPDALQQNNLNAGLAQVYPNPAGDELTIELQLKGTEPVMVSFFNALGQKIYSKTIDPVSDGNINGKMVFNTPGNFAQTGRVFYLNISQGSYQNTYPIFTY